MKASLWMHLKDTPQSKEVWSGDIDAIPPAGAHIFLSDDTGAFTVNRVMWDLPNNEVEIHVTAYSLETYEIFEEIQS
jgi:hypothetical protein